MNCIWLRNKECPYLHKDEGGHIEVKDDEIAVVFTDEIHICDCCLKATVIELRRGQT